MENMVGKERRTKAQGLVALRMIILCLTLIAACIFPAIPAQAATEPEFRLDMDSLNLQTGVSCSLVITLTNAQGAQVLDIEGLDSFDLISRNSSSSTTIIGGGVSHQETRYYTMMPKIAGDFKLKATISYNNQVFETNELQVTVSDSSIGGDESGRDLFVKTTLSRDEAYLGEKIVMTHTLYSRYSIENYGFSDSISIDGMIVKNTPNDRLKSDYVYLDGERYLMIEVNQSTIDPIRSGEYTIPSFNIRVDVITDNDMGGFGGGFGGMFRTTTTVYALTEEKELTVKPLPTVGKPTVFSGIVGQLRADGRYSRESMNYGESFVLNVTLSGECNLDGMKNVIGMSTPGFSVYETLKNTTESVENDRYRVEKSFEVIIVPERTGTLNMPTIQISYFNPETEKYEVAEIPGIAVEVLGNMPQTDSDGVDVGQPPAFEPVSIAQVNYSEGDEGYFKLRLKKELVYGTMIGLASALVVAFVLIWIFSGRKKQDATLRSLYKRIMGEGNIDEIYNLFSAMVKHCFDLSLKASPRAVIQNSLPDADLAAGLTGIMDYMETSGAREAEGNKYLKDKIKEIYHKLTATAKLAGKA